jgi:hypothetical protein
MTRVRDARLGRFKFLTINDDVIEAVGDSLEVVGGGVVPGPRRPRPLRLRIPIHAEVSETDAYDESLKIRRQARSLMQNAIAKLQGVYFLFEHDSELNCWLVIGAGEVSYVNGGITMGEFNMELQDCFNVANRRTHREARRAESYDRRLSTTPRDTLGTIFLTDFAAVTSNTHHSLPHGTIAPITGATRTSVPLYPRKFTGGYTYIANALTHGDVVSFERVEGDFHELDDVIVHDSRGQSDPTSGQASEILARKPVVFYRMGDADGSTVMTDSGENHLDGSYQGTPLFEAPSSNMDGDAAVGFSEADGAYARVADHALLDITGALTITAWIKPKDASGTLGIVSKDSGSSGSYGYRFSWDGPTDKLRFEISSDGTAKTTANSTVTAGITVDEWHHVAMVYDPTSTNVKFFKNGVQVGGAVGSLPASIFVNTRQLTIGKLDADA